MFLTVCGNNVICGGGVVVRAYNVGWEWGNDSFSRVNFYTPAPSECLSHNGCQISWLKMKKMKKKSCIFL